MPEWGSSGSVRGDTSNGVPYRDRSHNNEALAGSGTTWNVPDPNSIAAGEASKALPDTEFGAHRFAVYQELFLLRRREIVPRLVAASICDSRALGLRSEAAVWRMGDGSQLAIAANFAAEPVPMTCPMGRLLFESPIGSGDAAALGTLTARAAVAFLAGPVCQLSERSLKCLRIACEFAAPGAVARAEKIRSRPAGLFRRRCRVEG